MGVWIETQSRTQFVYQSASHPVWVCGLKQVRRLKRCQCLEVTPCMGVWIETSRTRFSCCPSPVTPCMGVWIETLIRSRYVGVLTVTPCMGVWIETLRREKGKLMSFCHTLYGCVD